MDLYTIRQELRSKSIYDLPLRVTFYARVSTDSDEQLNSLTNQVSYYSTLIRSKPNWTFVPGYVDEGISGATAKKRDEFQRMVKDARLGLFDLVLTKEITRFARNTLDSISYTRELLAAGVGVLFENDGINTFDEDSELRLTIMSGIAQDELRKLSSRVKFGHKQAIKNGVVLGNSRIFGYIKDSGRLIIDEEEAEMVRLLFEMYATGKYSMKQLETIFWEKGYRNHNGNKIAHTTMSSIISNPKYKGYYVGNKVKIVDLFSKKQKFLPPEEWVMFKDETGEIVPAIVSESLWDEANRVLTQRSNDVKRRKNISNHANLMTGKLFCTCCGVPYYRRETVGRKGDKNSRWVCSNKVKNGSDACPSISIRESELKPVLRSVFDVSGGGVRAAFEEYIKIFKELSSEESVSKEIEDIEKRIGVIEKKKQKLLSFNALGQLSDRDFIKMNTQLTEELDALCGARDELLVKRDNKKDIEKKINELRAKFESAVDSMADKDITRDFVEKYIDKVFVTPLDDGKTVKLDIRIITGDSFERSFEPSVGHTGQIVKSICPVCHTTFTRTDRTAHGHKNEIRYIAGFAPFW